MKRLIIIALGTFLALTGLLQAEPEPYPEVIAAFLFNLPKYTTWPEEKFNSPTSPIIIGVMGDTDDPVIQLAIEEIKGGMINGRPLIVKTFSQGREARQANLLWISSSVGSKIGGVLEDLKGASVVTVSAEAGFVDRGGMVELRIGDGPNSPGKLHVVAIHNTLAHQEKVKISSQVLRLAGVVK